MRAGSNLGTLSEPQKTIGATALCRLQLWGALSRSEGWGVVETRCGERDSIFQARQASWPEKSVATADLGCAFNQGHAACRIIGLIVALRCQVSSPPPFIRNIFSDFFDCGHHLKLSAIICILE